jgi:hypothetical protein
MVIMISAIIDMVTNEHEVSYDVDYNDETIVYDDDDQIDGRIDYNLHPFNDEDDDDLP